MVIGGYHFQLEAYCTALSISYKKHGRNSGETCRPQVTPKPYQYKIVKSIKSVKVQKNANLCCFQKLPFFGEQSYDAWREKERERGAGGREARVQSEESCSRGGRGTEAGGNTAVFW